MQDLGIEPPNSELMVDTLTTDPLGYIYTSVEISIFDRALEESLNYGLWRMFFFHASFIFCSTTGERLMA